MYNYIGDNVQRTYNYHEDQTPNDPKENYYVAGNVPYFYTLDGVTTDEYGSILKKFCNITPVKCSVNRHNKTYFVYAKLLPINKKGSEKSNVDLLLYREIPINVTDEFRFIGKMLYKIEG